MSSSPSYIIIGAGIFGTSTALHLKRGKPQSRVILIDRDPYPNGRGASSDLNKIIRADYADEFYMKLGLEALDQWRTEPLYKPFYHETGLLLAENGGEMGGMGQMSYRNYKSLGVESGAEIMNVEEGKKRFGKWFEKANWEGARDVYWSPKAGWGEADRAMEAMMKALIEMGVEYIEGNVEKLLLRKEDGGCDGVILDGGREMKADVTVCCAGARTALLLADTAPENKELQVDGRMVAACAVQCTVSCDPNYKDLYEGAPVQIIGMTTHGESIPLGPTLKLKFNYELSATRNTYHARSGQTISIPPAPISQNSWSHNVPQGMKDEVVRAVKHSYGTEMTGLTVESFRMCWDSVTANQDWIITPHPACPRLKIVGGGSFHSWKFLPNIGRYVVQMLDGTLGVEKQQRWAWNRPDAGGACVMYLPKRDLKDVLGYKEVHQSSRGTESPL